MLSLLLACRPSPVVSPPGPPDPPTVEATGETGSPDERTWVEISAWPCALDSEGFVQCWGGSDGLNAIAALPSNPEPVTTFRVHPLNAMGILPSGSITSWYCPPGEAECRPPEDVQALDVSTGCAWLVSHEVVCWDEGVPHGPPGLIRNFAPFGVGAVSLSNDFVARMDDAGGTFFTQQLEPADIVAVDHFGRSFCTLDAEGEVECHGSPSWWEDTPPPPVFPNPPYVAIDGDSTAFCAQRADHVLECHNGETFDFGPLRDFAVGNRGYLVDDDGIAFTEPVRVQPTLDGPFELCVITEANAIECVGPPQFTPELLANLPN